MFSHMTPGKSIACEVLAALWRLLWQRASCRQLLHGFSWHTRFDAHHLFCGACHNTNTQDAVHCSVVYVLSVPVTALNTRDAIHCSAAYVLSVTGSTEPHPMTGTAAECYSNLHWRS